MQNVVSNVPRLHHENQKIDEPKRSAYCLAPAFIPCFLNPPYPVKKKKKKVLTFLKGLWRTFSPVQVRSDPAEAAEGEGEGAPLPEVWR